LFLACPVPTGETGALADACRLLDEWRSNDVATEILKQQAAAARMQRENDQKTVWWQHIHLDALWPMTQGTSGVYGILGLHTTIDVTGRVERSSPPAPFSCACTGPSGSGSPPTGVSVIASPISRCRG
jgi:hypothetical protein